MQNDLINEKTPGEIKRILEWISSECGYFDCDHCQYNDICYPQNGRENIVARDALALIEHLEAQLDKARLVQDCSNCGEDYCDLHSYPCCACEPVPPTRMSKWHPEGTEAEPRKEKRSETEPGSTSIKDYYSKRLLDMYRRGEIYE